MGPLAGFLRSCIVTNMKLLSRARRVPLAIVLISVAAPAAAQESASPDPAPAPEATPAKPPMRTRITLGPQTAPRYPGADNGSLFPYFNVERTRRPYYDFEAPDESGGFNLFRSGGFSFGPSYDLQGSRRRSDTDRRLHRVGFTVELGAAAQYLFNPNFRVRGEVRKGLSGHKGVVGILSADYIRRDADNWLFSVGPRLTFSDAKLQRAYFGVTQAEAPTANLPAYSPGGGLQAAGAAGSAMRRIGDRWGLYGYAKYDRLVGDAADSPVVATFGSRNQISAGLGLMYTFGG